MREFNRLLESLLAADYRAIMFGRHATDLMIRERIFDNSLSLEKSLKLQRKELPEQLQRSNVLESSYGKKRTNWQNSQATVLEDSLKDLSNSQNTRLEKTIDILLKPANSN